MNTNLKLLVLAFVIAIQLPMHAALNEQLDVTNYVSGEALAQLRVGIVKAQWNADVVETMYLDCLEELLAHGVKDSHITRVTVPGSLELSYAAEKLFIADACDICICLGAIIEGNHGLWAEALAHAVIKNISEISTLFAKPIICGVVIGSNDQVQALAADHIGAVWARSALMMNI